MRGMEDTEALLRVLVHVGSETESAICGGRSVMMSWCIEECERAWPRRAGAEFGSALDDGCKASGGRLNMRPFGLPQC